MALADVHELNPDLDGSLSLGDVDDIDVMFDSVVAALRTRATADALARSDRFQNMLLAFEAELVAGELAAGVGDREAEDLVGRGSTRSKREAKKRAIRAKAVNVNPTLASDLAAGKLSPEGLDAIAYVSEQSNGAAAGDTELIENVKAALPDQIAAITRRWLDDHTEPDEHERRHQRQRRLRNITRRPTRNGLESITAEGDKESIAEIWAILNQESKALYRADGGRDLAPEKHPRTRHQRLYDAFHAAITSAEPSGRSNRTVQVYVTLTLDELLDGATKARLAGGSSIPQPLLDQYLTGDARVAGMLFDGDGHILWHGRNKRWATQPQLCALIARDQGCVLCETAPSSCDAHHLTPYNSPAQGNTNTNELALLCTDCHHHIHTTKQTLWCQPHPHTRGKLTWRLRPATPNELPP